MLFRLFKYLNVLSLDVVTGAAICSLYTAQFLKVNPDWPSLIILCLVVWVIYTFDHLLDAREGISSQMSDRHQFHKDHFKLLSILSSACLLIIASMLFLLPVETLLLGAVLSGGVLSYFLLLHLLGLKASYHKEPMIALIYAAGVMLGPVSIYEGDLNWMNFIMFLQFAVIALLNLFIFSWYDHDYDRESGFPSLILILGKRKMGLVIKCVGAITLSIQVLLMNTPEVAELELMFMLMTVTLLMLHIMHENFRINDRYRLIGDAVFCFPLIYLVP